MTIIIANKERGSICLYLLRGISWRNIKESMHSASKAKKYLNCVALERTVRAYRCQNNRRSSPFELVVLCGVEICFCEMSRYHEVFQIPYFSIYTSRRQN